MELKKSPEVDLERKKNLFMEIGLVCALLFCIGLFSIGQAKITYNPEIAPMPVLADEEIIEITREPEKIETQAPKASVQVTSDILNIVRNDEKIETEMIFEDFMEDAIIAFDASAGGGGGYSVDDEGAVPFAIIENPPKFPQGDFLKWVQENTVYPPTLERMNFTGRVVYSFVIGTDGSVGEINVISSPHQLMTDAVKAALAKTPKWTPGSQRGRPVKVSNQGYVDFVL